MNRPEQILHKQVVAYLRVSLTGPWLFWHTPNGGGRSKVEASIFKAMGVRAGVPDLIILGPERQMACIEFKAKKGALSPAQKDTINALGVLGVPTIIVRSLDEAERVLREMGVPLKGRAL